MIPKLGWRRVDGQRLVYLWAFEIHDALLAMGFVVFYFERPPHRRCSFYRGYQLGFYGVESHEKARARHAERSRLARGVEARSEDRENGEPVADDGAQAPDSRRHDQGGAQGGLFTEEET